MRAKKPLFKFAGIVVVVLLLVLFGSTLHQQEAFNQNDMGIMQLVRPAIAHASNSETSFLTNEAGITAFINVGGSVNLNNVRPHFNTIEKETSTYIIGSVTPDKYGGGSEDVHMYINTGGWFVAYYNRGAPASQIVDWKNYAPGSVSTKMHNAILKMTPIAGYSISPSQIQMYDFSNPSANKVMIAAGTSQYSPSVPGEFYITVPAGVTLFRASASIGRPEDSQTWYFYQDFPIFKLTGGSRKHCTLTREPSIYYRTIRIDGEVILEVNITQASGWPDRAGSMAFVLVYTEN